MLTFSKQFRNQVIDHMDENPDWTIYSIAKLLNYSEPTDLLKGLSKLSRLELVAHRRVKAEDAFKGWTP